MSHCHNKIRAWVALCLICAMAVSCARPPVKAPETGPEPAPFHSVLVLPFLNMASAHGENTSVRSPLSGKGFVTGSVAPGASIVLTDALVQSLGEVYADRTIRVVVKKDQMHMEILGTENRAELLARIAESGRARSADAVLLGFVYDYQERFGRDYGVERPAQVALELNLVHAASGRLIWQGRFEEQQAPLNTNLLKIKDFFRRKGRWITAREMAEMGIEDLMRELAQKYH